MIIREIFHERFVTDELCNLFLSPSPAGGRGKGVRPKPKVALWPVDIIMATPSLLSQLEYFPRPTAVPLRYNEKYGGGDATSSRGEGEGEGSK